MAEEGTEKFSQGFSVCSKLIESCGRNFVKYLRILKEGDEGLCLEERFSSEDSLTEVDLDAEDDYVYLRSLDPKEWKSQDHYAVLGLKAKRHKATFAEIRSAYRLKVLKHHPDKRKASGEIINREDDYFTCITKAWEILGDKSLRRSYDSVDPFFDNSVPSNSDYNKTNFFEVFAPVFKKNSRWSEKQPVPQLGKIDDPRSAVDNFYAFWYNFDSWREYSYEDEESKDKAQDRDERKWIERQNKAIRAKKKKEEMVRIRNLVDLAYQLDPRIAKFKLEDKEKKEAQKRAKVEAARARQEEIDRAQQEEDERRKKEKEEAEAAERAKQSALKAEREAQKRLLRKEKKAIRDLCKANNYFISSPENLIQNMEYMEKMCDTNSLKDLEELKEDLKKGGKDVFLEKVKELEIKLERERQKLICSTNQKQDMNNMVKGSKQNPWPQSHINLLIKAVNLFPAGTSQRWEVVANFINQHSKNGSCLRSAKEVLSKAKDLQTNDDFNHQLKTAANKKAFQVFEQEKKPASSVDEVETSQRFDGAEQSTSTTWTSEEQQLLEQALKTYPASTPDRWDQIAACLPSRSKKDCMKRYKELVEMVKAKKAAEKGLKSTK